MSKKKKKVVMARVIRVEEDDGLFDLIFWNKIGVQGKFEAAWQMVCDLYNWSKKYERQQRLRRSVASVKRRKS